MRFTLPTYLRGLCLFGRFAVVGLCQIRKRHIFGELPVQQRLAQLLSGLTVVDLPTGKLVGTFEFIADCTEIYDVQFLPGMRRPNVLNPADATRQAFTAPNFSYWLRPDHPRPSTEPTPLG